MTMKPNGGPAFPNPALADERFSPPYDMSGMTLRDYFAGQVLQQICVQAYHADAAKDAYEYADAMIAAREVQP